MESVLFYDLDLHPLKSPLSAKIAIISFTVVCRSPLRSTLFPSSPSRVIYPDEYPDTKHSSGLTKDLDDPPSVLTILRRSAND